MKRWKSVHPLSLHHLTMLNAHPLQLIDAAAAGGFEYCGIRIVAPMDSDPIVDVVNNPSLIRQIQQRLQATGVQLLDIEAIWIKPETEVRQLIPALEVGRRLGARHVLAVGFDQDHNRLLDNFSRLCEVAARLDMHVGLEFITYCSIGTLDDALALIRDSRQPNAALLIDVLQFFRSGATCSQLAAVDPTLIKYMQICDGPKVGPVTIEERRREARTARLLPGEGELPIADLLKMMPAGIPLSVEAPTQCLAGLAFEEQARIAGDATRRLLNSTSD
jgi:sugar phosphate isomerase/epimerase